MTAATSATAGAESGDRARQALWAALVLIVVWGANFSVQKAVFQALSPGGFLFGPSLLNTVFLASARLPSVFTLTAAPTVAVLPVPGSISTAPPLMITFAAEISPVIRVRLLPISIASIYHTGQLPAHHKDPFDRLIAAQCLRHNLAVISANSIFDNYGVNRVRFVTAVPVHSRLRGRFRPGAVEAVADGAIQVTWHVTVEREGQDKPAAVVEWIVRYYV